MGGILIFGAKTREFARAANRGGHAHEHTRTHARVAEIDTAGRALYRRQPRKHHVGKEVEIKRKTTALADAACRGHIDVVKFLLAASAKLSEVVVDMAAKRGRSEVVSVMQAAILRDRAADQECNAIIASKRKSSRKRRLTF